MAILASPTFLRQQFHSHRNHNIHSIHPAFGSSLLHWKFRRHCLSRCRRRDENVGYVVQEASRELESDDKFGRRLLFLIATTTTSSFVHTVLPSYGKSKIKNPYDERRLLEQNKRIQRENNAPDDFPSFVRKGFEVKVVTSDAFVKSESGLIYKDFEVGKGECPKAGQQVTFHYIGYNESGRRIDSTYLQGAPAKIRFGTNGLVPGFEEGIRDMKPGGKRRIIIPPELGPPVGPSTFFSAKQFEVFDVELLGVKDCERRTIGFYSDIVCN